MSKRLFRQKHPIVFGLFILGCFTVFIWGGITFFIAKVSSRNGSKAEFFHKGSAGIGVIDIKGVIVASDELIADITDFRRDTGIKAIIVRIDSPGGAVGASQELYEEIRLTAESKPVVASMASVAASGGFYAALGANKIVANPGTLTGSIGVILKFANIEEILNKIGYKDEVIKSGPHKDIGSFNRSLTEEERKLLQGMIDNVHSQFVEAVYTSRSIEKEQAQTIADGRIFTGEQALELGLVDQLGNFTEAIKLAASLSGVKYDDTKLIYPQQKDFTLLRFITGEQSSTSWRNLLPSSPALVYEWVFPSR